MIALKTGACCLYRLCFRRQQSFLNKQTPCFSVKMLWLIAHCFDSQTGYYKRKLACFHRQHCPLETCLLMAFDFASLLHNSKLALLLTTDFLGQRTVRVKALQLARRTISAALIPPAHTFDGVLGLTCRTASQVELSSHTNRSDRFWRQMYNAT